MPESKRCGRCGETKPLAEFYPHAHCRLGVRPECRLCTDKAQRVYREAHRPQARHRTREWHDAQGREATAAAARHRYATDSEYRERVKASARATYRRATYKRAARNAVQRALTNGELVKEPCLFCDDPDTHAHHHDYAAPLDVTWLCRKHHGLAHRIVDEPVSEAPPRG